MLNLSLFIALAGFLMLLYTGRLLGYSAKISARIQYLYKKAELDPTEKGELQYYKIDKVITCIGWTAFVVGTVVFVVSWVFT